MQSNPNQTTQPLDLLRDPNRVTVSVSQAAQILGIAKSTAHAAYKATGYLAAGVPVVQVGRRCVVSVFYLRAALGINDPANSLTLGDE
jgi:hypothetical protein